MNADKAIGVMFISIAIGIFAASSITLLIDTNIVTYASIWFVSLALPFFIAFKIFKDLKYHLRQAFANSKGWSNKAKAINALAWSIPFALAIIINSYYPYFILLAIGLGNITTYAINKRSKVSANKGQFVVGSISLLSLPLLSISFIIGFEPSTLLRFIIAIAYGIGGLTNLMA